MIELRVLGGAFLSRDGVAVRGRAAQRHHLGLLAALGASPGQHASRDKLIARFWPESEQAKARHRLSVALHVLRHQLGHDAIITAGDGISLNSSRVWTDVGCFTESVGSGRLGEAVEIYRGPFLDGFFLDGVPEFDPWVEAERARLAELYRAALEQLIAEAEERKDPAGAARWWKRLASHDPFSAPTALGAIRALSASGDVGGAVRHARGYAALVKGELGLAPDSQVLELIEELSGRAVEPGSVARSRQRGRNSAEVVPPREAPVAAESVDTPHGPSWRFAVVVAAGAALVVLLGFFALLGRGVR